ncbi:hypothetical protein L7F22_065626 [Adiantum nelumboides]|nr:hypothetical protein [Adiantum nelumboides]
MTSLFWQALFENLGTKLDFSSAYHLLTDGQSEIANATVLDLLKMYRITEGISLPFRVFPSIKELGRTRMEVNVKVKSVFGAKMFALGVVVKVPVPKQTAKASFQVTNGKAKYNATLDCLVWKVRKFPGQTEATMSAEVELISTIVEKKSWTRPPIQMEFQVPMFTASGLRVRFLKVWEKSGYSTVEWVRYITRAGSYEIRC